jgi:hypothetical protein
MVPDQTISSDAYLEDCVSKDSARILEARLRRKVSFATVDLYGVLMGTSLPALAKNLLTCPPRANSRVIINRSYAKADTSALQSLDLTPRIVTPLFEYRYSMDLYFQLLMLYT